MRDSNPAPSGATRIQGVLRRPLSGVGLVRRGINADTETDRAKIFRRHAVRIDVQPSVRRAQKAKPVAPLGPGAVLSLEREPGDQPVQPRDFHRAGWRRRTTEELLPMHTGPEFQSDRINTPGNPAAGMQGAAEQQ
jgi:hypothetical protein